MTPDEIERKVGAAVADSYRIVNEPAGNHAEMVYLGQSSQGIPAWVNRAVAQSDVRIGIGMIMPHLDTGYGGGAKIVLPGVCSEAEVYGVPVERQYPLVIANAHPHQIDLWQCTKALAAGERLTRSGGTLILVAGCPEGTGPHPRFADYIGMALDALLQRVRGGAIDDRCATAEAVAICRLKRRIRIGMVCTGLPAGTARRMGIERYASVEAAIRRKRRRIGKQRIAVLTRAGVTLPLLPDGSSLTNGTAGA